MDNAVGSLELPKVLHARKNLILALTDRQRQILIGCVIGDAHITRLGKINIEQSVKQKEYLMWKYMELKSLAYPAMPREVIRKDLRSNRNKNYYSLVFYLRQYFRPWRAIFYQENKKVFPEKLYLTPLSLAVWYMDDGCQNHGNCIISTDGFDETSRKNIQNAFYEQFGIETSLKTNGKLSMRWKSQPKFYEIIRPYVVPSMKYKVPDPVTTLSHGEKSKGLNFANTSAPPKINN